MNDGSSKTVLGVSLGHDTNFSLITGGRIVEIFEAERYFRQKRYKLSALTLEPGPSISGYQYVDIAELEAVIAMLAKKWGKRFDALAVQNQGRMEEHANLVTLLTREGFSLGAVHNVNHHLSHAALAFYTSPFPESLVLSYDGTGNDGYTLIFKADGFSGVQYLQNAEIRFGQNYNNLGFIINVHPDISGTSSGKTMGLAAYGTVRDDWMAYARTYVLQYRKLRQAKDIHDVASYGRGHRINAVGLNEIPDLQQFVIPEEQTLKERVKGILGSSAPEKVLRLPGPEDRNAQDLVKTVQKVWTDEVLNLLNPLTSESRNLCIVGGCALNGITNYTVQEQNWFPGIHFVPNASDCGLSAGAALQVYHTHCNGGRFEGYGDYFSPYLGQEPFDLQDLDRLKQSYPSLEVPPPSVSAVLAGLIWKDLIVGVIRGRYEVGPRALGNRSILCNPLNKSMRTVLNEKVKHREWFRPFAPVATVEDAHRYFTNYSEIPYMSVICHTQSAYRELLPSVTHVDGSARLQTIRKDHNPFLYATLREFEKLSGMPVLLNTSYNPGGEPILNYCHVGLEMLVKTDLDMVLIENTFFAAPGKSAVLDIVQALKDGR